MWSSGACEPLLSGCGDKECSGNSGLGKPGYLAPPNGLPFGFVGLAFLRKPGSFLANSLGSVLKNWLKSKGGGDSGLRGAVGRVDVWWASSGYLYLGFSFSFFSVFSYLLFPTDLGV